MVLCHRRDIADDLVQATYVRALEHAAQFSEGTRLDRWLFSILHSIWLNEVRAQHIRQGQGFVDAEELADSASNEDPIWANQVMQRVNRLPEAQRNTVFLVYVEELSYREAAEVLGVPIGTIMSRLAAARLRLANDSVLQSTPTRSKGEQS
ncbi:RNA polymerase sigma24 factor [Serratia sp. Ag1]|nr:RNA polymerase sigma24 factor [Serratia sp. Ag2]KFK99352.1 RNA polymerase sigma24 factor [Serratia sp. Ag1]